MRRHRSITISAWLCATAFLPAIAIATPASYTTIYGAATANAGDGPYNADQYHTQTSEFGSAHDTFPGAQTGRADASAQGNLTGLFGVAGSAQGAVASGVGGVSFGALHGSASAGTSTNRYWYHTTAEAVANVGWFDTLTFHTSDPLGANYTYSITLDDALSSVIRPFVDPTYHGGLVKASAFTALSVDSSNVGLSLSDTLRQDPSYDGVTPGVVTRTPPANRTVSGVIHVQDGEVVTFQQIFYVLAESDNLDSGATAIANDTAYFNLVSFDAGASYTAASGTIYATSGDPDLGPVVGPPATGSVPEPSSIALLFAGLAGLIGAGRRVRDTKAAAGPARSPLSSV